MGLPVPPDRALRPPRPIVPGATPGPRASGAREPPLPGRNARPSGTGARELDVARQVRTRPVRIDAHDHSASGILRGMPRPQAAASEVPFDRLRGPSAVILGRLLLAPLAAACLLLPAGGLLAPEATDARAPSGRPTQGPDAPESGTPGSRTSDAEDLARTAPEAVAHHTRHKRCTGWRSTLTPPPTIWVLRTRGTAVRKAHHPVAQRISFRDYTLAVLGTEWPGFYPFEALKAGAVGVKQYGWYFTIVYRGGVDRRGHCYDVRDTGDGYYRPERYEPAPIHAKALAATWGTTVRKVRPHGGGSRFFLPGYRAGSARRCGKDHDGFHIFQHSAFDCGRPASKGGQSMTAEQILRTYLSPRLEIVQPGSHDIVGAEFGDASALVTDGDGMLTPHIWSTGRTALGPAGGGSAGAGTSGAGGPFAATGLIGQASVDLDLDGHDDLLLARAVDHTSIRFLAALSDGVSYGELKAWTKTIDVGARLANAMMLAGDYDGDGRTDAELLLPGADEGSARLLVFLRKPGHAFAAPRTRWRGQLDLSLTRAWAPDVNGDGRADLLVREDLGGGGLRYSVARSRPKGGTLLPMHQRFLGTNLIAGKTVEVVGDADRDGRDDLWLVVGGDGRTHVDRLLARNGNVPFARTTVWTARKADPLPVGRIRTAASDVDDNGFGDLVLYVKLLDDKGDPAGTRIMSLESHYGRMTPGVSVEVRGLDWSGLRPY